MNCLASSFHSESCNGSTGCGSFIEILVKMERLSSSMPMLLLLLLLLVVVVTLLLIL